MIAVDLFSGAGGMSLGAIQAGVDVRNAVEVDPYAANTYSRNHPGTLVHAVDIRNFQIQRPECNGQDLVVFGGPPCQGFSTSNQRTRSSSNPNNWLWTEFMRIVSELRPEYVVFENVKGILETENGIFVEQVQETFHGLGYNSVYDVLCATDFGVPQKRQRFFLIAAAEGSKVPDFPKPTVGNTITVEDAFRDLPSLNNGASICRLKYRCAPKSKYAKSLRGDLSFTPNNLVTNNADLIIERYKHVPQGGNWENIPADLMKNYKDRSRCHTGIYRRLKATEPSVVIGNYRKNMLIHPTEHRGLSVREAARLQSFPDSYVFQGSIGFQQQQVGNAVPPLLARAVFSTLKKFGGKLNG